MLQRLLSFFRRKPSSEPPRQMTIRVYDWQRQSKPKQRREGTNIVSEPTGDGPVYSTIGIFYEDAYGNETDRVISIGQISVAEHDGEHTKLLAWCHEMNDIRTFRADRIKGFFDPKTGELISKAQLGADSSVLRRAPAPRDDF